MILKVRMREREREVFVTYQQIIKTKKTIDKSCNGCEAQNRPCL